MNSGTRFDSRISRRILLGGASAGTAAAFLTRGAGAQGGRIAAPALHLNQQGGANLPTPREQTLVISSNGTSIFDSFNPYVPNGEATSEGVHELCREAFFYMNFMTGELVPWLATGYEYNQDYTEFTLKLDPAAAWSDGTPVTADDMLFTFDMLRNNDQLYGSSTVTDSIAEATAVDAKTVLMKLTGPLPRFHNNFIGLIWGQWIRLVPKHVWEGQDGGTFKNNPPVYSGPYVLDRTVPEQFMYVWKKNPNYWNKARLDAAPEYVVYRKALPVDAEIQEFIRGNIDIPSIDALTIPVVTGQYDQVATAEWTDPCPRGIHLNHMSASGLFAKPEGRWAISYLLDRNKIAETIWQPPSRPALYPWADWESMNTYSNAEIQGQYDLSVFDPDKAAELLDSIGATMSGDRRQLDGKDLKLSLITPVEVGKPEYQIGQMLADEAKKIGLDITVTYLQTEGDASSKGDFDLDSSWICGAIPDPATWYGSNTADPEEGPTPIGEAAVTNPQRANIPELYDVAEQLSLVGPDSPEAKPLYDQALELFLKNLIELPTIQTVQPKLYGTAYWTGWPTTDNLYAIPNWDWTHFILVLAQLKPSAGA